METTINANQKMAVTKATTSSTISTSTTVMTIATTTTKWKTMIHQPQWMTLKSTLTKSRAVIKATWITAAATAKRVSPVSKSN